jgi:hypothetical protein
LSQVNLKQQMLRLLIYESLVVLLLNLPFGYWRIHVKKFSIQWIFAIHIPVIFIIGLRLFTNIGFSWYSYVFMVMAFFTGQKLGGYIHNYMSGICDKITSCMIMDMIRCSKNHK